ncbi:MAG: serine/threonine-protein kinase [Pseudomonadota bacterium]
MTHALALATGTELVQDYRIERVLGAGGFGITYLADEVPLARSVTLKEYFPSDFAARVDGATAVPKSEGCRLDFSWGLDRFVDEAQILARFDHPNIVKVYRYFRANGTAYMALKWEEGQSLKAWLKELKRTPRQVEIDDILGPLLDALEVVHTSDFLHRDIAPDNIIIRSDGSPVLIDFGSARGDLAQRSRTVSALVKPGYSPYEQYAEDSAKQGPWTDIYALGSTLYFLISGKRPSDAPSRVVHDDVKPAQDAALGAFRPGFLKAIDRALALDIDKRPKSVAQWRKELFQEDAKRSLFGRKAPTPTDGERSPTAKATIALDVSDAAPAPEPAAPAPQKDDADVQVVSKPPVQEASPAKPAAMGGLIARLRQGVSRKAAPPTPNEVKPSPAAEAVAEEVVPEEVEASPVPEPEARRRHFGIGWGPAPRQAEQAASVEAEAAKPVAVPAPRPPGSPAGRAIQAIAAIDRPIAKRKPPRLRRKPFIKWRSLAVKLVLGALVAGGAVALQKSLPREPSGPGGPTGNAPARTYLLHQFRAHEGGVTSIVFARAGNWLVTTGADNTLKIWSPRSTTPVRTIQLEHGAATALAIRGDVAITGHDEGDIAVWDLASGERRAHFKRNDARIWAIAFADRGANRIVTAGHDWAIAVWDIDKPATPFHVFEGHGNAVQSLAVNIDQGRLISGSADKSLRVWNLRTLSLDAARGRAHRDFVSVLALDPSGERLASGDLTGGIRIWSGNTTRRLRRWSAHNAAVTALAFLPDRRYLASASRDGRLIIWNVNRGRSVRTFGSRGNEINAIAVAPNRREIATAGADGSVRLWDTRLPAAD